MIGFYQPESLTLVGQVGSIDFINGFDASDVRKVEFGSPREAQDIAAALRDQRDYKLAVLGGTVRKLMGVLSYDPDEPDQFLLSPKDDPAAVVRLRALFPLPEGGIPATSLAILYAAPVDGGLGIVRLAARSLEPAPQIEPDREARQDSH